MTPSATDGAFDDSSFKQCALSCFSTQLDYMLCQCTDTCWLPATYFVCCSQQVCCHFVQVWSFGCVEETQHLLHHLMVHICDFHPVLLPLLHLMLKHSFKNGRSCCKKEKTNPKIRGRANRVGIPYGDSQLQLTSVSDLWLRHSWWNALRMSP